MKKHVLALAVSFLVVPLSPASAAPAVNGVSGTPATGQSVRISGSGFGVKSPAAPHLWADFATGIDPSPLGQKKSWAAIGNMTWAANEGYNGGGGAKASDGGGNWTLGTDAASWTADGQKSYIYKRTKANFRVTDPSQNWKIWRVWSESGKPNIYIASNNNRAFVEYVGGDDPAFWGEFNTDSTGWVTEEIAMKASTLNTKNGQLTYRVDGVDRASGSIRTRSSAAPDQMTLNYPFHCVLANVDRWGPAWNSQNRVWADNVYVDTTWARVMIGDAATFTSCRNLDIQIPTQWTEGSVTVVANTPSFSNGARAYLYVFDKDGNVNANGYAVTIGQGVASSNQSPAVSAGPDRRVALSSAFQFAGEISDDGRPTPVSLTATWSQVSGPTGAPVTTPSSKTSAVRFTREGSYVFRLTASDGALSASDDVAVTVGSTAQANVAPQMDAGDDQTVRLPNKANLSASFSDDGLPSNQITCTWTKVSGPGTVSFGDIHEPATTAAFSREGTYVLEASASDGKLATDDTLSIVVSPQTGMVGGPAVTTLSGEFTTGQQVRMTGKNFGVKSPAAPLVFADFETGLQPSPLGQIRSWSDVESMQSSNEGANGTKGAKASDGDGDWWFRVDRDDWTGDGKKIYIHRRERVNFMATDPGQEWKIWEMKPGSSDVPNLYVAPNTGRVDVENLGAEGGFWGNFASKTMGWMSTEIQFQASSASNRKDGLLVLRSDGVEKARGSVMTRSSLSPRIMNTNFVVQGVASDTDGWNPRWSNNNRMWVDNVYVDNTWARIMLGDAPTYAACRKFDVQVPAAWSDTTVTFVAQTGAFASGSRAYLYVFDKDGKWNENGVSVTVGRSVQALTAMASDGTDAAPEKEPVKNVFNPARGEQANIPYAIQESGFVKVHIYDRYGSAVTEFSGDAVSQGSHTVRWDGRNHEGSMVASGIYLAVLKTTDGSHSREKVVVIK